MARNSEAKAIESWVRTHASDEEKEMLRELEDNELAYQTKVLKLYCEWSLREFPWDWRV